MLVARGTVYEIATVVHGVQLAEDEVKVTVDEVVIADAVLPVPTDEFFNVEEAFKSFVVWPRHLVGDVSNPPQIGQEGSPPPKKTHLSEDDPLGALDELAKIISDEPMNVHWDSTTFGRETQIPLYLHHQDVRELASGREEINITLIQLWMMYMFYVSNKKGFNDVYGFIDPSMTHERNKFDDIQTYITPYFGMGKEIYFLPYIHGCHWQLLVISIPENIAVWFCSLQKSPPSPLRHVVDCSLATHMMLSGRSTATAKKLAWVALKCNRQMGSYDCGYYVMFWMMTIIRAHYTTGWETVIFRDLIGVLQFQRSQFNL
ncbi:hypothetical protein LR48_Vigan09g120100 [Vigna angularis]|uniref:Ubiquitin-like protease family profile domain-containing protein n=1 Tax=Phaseolus angularis TaxID=3914 RepID=A0A0L9VCA6_PHAAN|nr:hypothetical protein LR48_Vigan09g120100 [Vigna angularis]